MNISKVKNTVNNSRPNDGCYTSPSASPTTNFLAQRLAYDPVGQAGCRASSAPPIAPNSESQFIPIQDDDTKATPRLVHRWRGSHSVLCLVTLDNLLFAGTQNGEIIVYDLETYAVKSVLKAHDGSIYSLCLTPTYLFSASSDSLIRVYDIETLKPVYTIYSIYDIGDIFTVLWSPQHETLFMGAQNASIQWIHLSKEEASSQVVQDPSGLPSLRFNRFFDSKGPGGKMAPQQSREHSISSRDLENTSHKCSLMEIPPQNIVPYAHFGYVYAMTVASRPVAIGEEEVLISGGGDGTIKIWSLKGRKISLLHSINTQESVLSLTHIDLFLYCGLADGLVEVWDLDTLQMIRSDKQGDDDTAILAVAGDCVFRGSKGIICKWDPKRYFHTQWQAHSGLILAAIVDQDNTSNKLDTASTLLITGGNDSTVAIWDISSINSTAPSDITSTSIHDNHMIKTLGDFVAYKSVSGCGGRFVSDCRKCATYLRSLLKHFGADSKLIPVADGGNPLVYARFKATGGTRGVDGGQNVNGSSDKPCSILFYGHYDVIAADSSRWETDPFDLTALDGYLYGRGVSDNKGPILAAIFAVAELAQKSQLVNDVVFLIEGEEESGSKGFQNAVLENKELIGDIDWILLSNSYWLDDSTPCLNYGLRGTINMTVEVKGDQPDLHSGVHGGVFREPTIDLVNLMSKLTSDTGKILLPDFYDSVRAVDQAEESLYDAIIAKPAFKNDKQLLMGKWRYPSLTIHRVDVSGPGNATVIPQIATASVSLRIVPDQDISHIKAQVHRYLEDCFATFDSDNSLSITIFHEADPWVGDPSNAAFQILRRTLRDEWDVEPLFIREGGSIPVVRFLEKAFNAPAAQLPCGQASDGVCIDDILQLFDLYEMLIFRLIWIMKDCVC